MRAVCTHSESLARSSASLSGLPATQAAGIDQVNKALTQMDTVTQQNSALVEENAATAKTLEQQSSQMDQRVSFFRSDIDGKEAVVAIKAAGERRVA